MILPPFDLPPSTVIGSKPLQITQDEDNDHFDQIPFFSCCYPFFLSQAWAFFSWTMSVT